MSSPAAAIWWFNHCLRAHLVVSCALHYMSPWQTFSLQNAQPQPQWVDEALLGSRQGEEAESGVPIEPRRQQWDSSKAMTVYYCCLPSMLIKIAHDGFSRSVGDGAWQMKEVLDSGRNLCHRSSRNSTKQSHYSCQWRASWQSWLCRIRTDH